MFKNQIPLFNKMKRGGTIMFLVMLSFLLIVPLASANIFTDFWGKITGYDTQGTTSVNITVGNAAPTVPFVYGNASYFPTEDTTTSITFNFTADDDDGAGNLNDSTAAAYFQRTGETTRSNTSCVQIGAAVSNSKNYTCTIDMWYFDEAATWTINATIQDINDAVGENSTTTFTYQLLTAMVLNPGALTWPSISLTTTDEGSNNDPVRLNNTGNDENLTINSTAFNLRGETEITEFIFANNFTIGNATEGCTGFVTTQSNATSLAVNGTELDRGNHSVNDGTTGQEDLFFCLKGVPDISAQSYSSSAYGSWTVDIIT